MKMRNTILILLIFNISVGVAQSDFRSIMREESERYRTFSFCRDEQYDSIAGIVSHAKTQRSHNACVLTKMVFGWHPYWNGTVYNNYQWNLLSDLCYFNYDVSPSSGNNVNGSFAWNTSSAVTVAQNNGTRIHICATMFGGHSTFWASQVAQSTFISNIVSLLNARNGNGVNIDFEGMGASDKVPFASFIANLKTALVNANPNYKLSVCLYAVEWSSTFDIAALNAAVDFFTVMGYDYYYSGSAQAGPTSPLYNFQTGYNYTVSKSITYYLKQGIPASKLVMGLPYYGREWEVTGTGVPANTTGNFNSSRTLSYVNNNPATYSISNKFWESTCFSPFFKIVNGGNDRQCWIDDIYSMGRKFDMVNQRRIGGIGIWALGYDNGMVSYWDLIRDKFSDCGPVVCNDSLFDMGGPARNYYDNEKYIYTISAPTGSMVQLQFKSFGVEQNYDSLWIYNGTGTISPLVGAYTGTNSPGTVISSGQYLTLRFKSDGATSSFGFKIIKTCLAQSLPAGVRSNTPGQAFSIYPNPGTGEIAIHANGDLALQIFDLQGKEVSPGIFFRQQTVINSNGLNLAPGYYLVKLTDEKGISVVKKLVITD